MKLLIELRMNCDEIKGSLMDMAVYIDCTSYEMLLNMPVTDRDLLVRSYNRKVKKQNSS